MHLACDVTKVRNSVQGLALYTGNLYLLLRLDTVHNEGLPHAFGDGQKEMQCTRHDAMRWDRQQRWAPVGDAHMVTASITRSTSSRSRICVAVSLAREGGPVCTAGCRALEGKLLVHRQKHVWAMGKPMAMTLKPDSAGEGQVP